ncbi:MAG: hypothetical protein DLM63_00055 [Solirubrobacterales bacterium]|nr:MAG: hypothetical protein DLM63_00055 [Solirubrobacterales bacterium]
MHRAKFPAGAADVKIPRTAAIPSDPVRGALADLVAVRGRKSKAVQRLHEAEAAVLAAREADAKTGAEALRAGKPAPAPTAIAKADAARGQAERAADLLDRASADVHGALLATLSSEAESMRAALDVEDEAGLERQRALVEALRREVGLAQARGAVRTWITDPHRFAAPESPTSRALNAVEQTLTPDAPVRTGPGLSTSAGASQMRRFLEGARAAGGVGRLPEDPPA